MDGVTHELTLQDVENDPNCITKSTCIVRSNVHRAIINAEAAKAFGKRNNVFILWWKHKLSLDFPLSVEAILHDKNERPELFAYFVQGQCGQVFDNTHGNVYFGVKNGTACTMHSLAWDDPEDKKDAHNTIRTSTPGQVIDLPKPPNHIIVDIKLKKGIKWPHHLNLSPNSNLIQIPIRLASQCKKKVKVRTQESVTYYAHAVDLAFAITVWKCQGGTFDYIIALLKHTPGSPTLTFEKLYVMFTRVKIACKFWCLPLSPAFNKAKLHHLHPKILATKWRVNIDKSRYWKPHVANSPALSVPKISKAVAARKKNK